MEDECLTRYNPYRRTRITAKGRCNQIVIIFVILLKNIDSAFSYTCIKCNESLNSEDFFNKTKNNRYNRGKKCKNEKMKCKNCEKYISKTKLFDRKNLLSKIKSERRSETIHDSLNRIEKMKRKLIEHLVSVIDSVEKHIS